jgi:hypothetical protein
MAGRSVIVPEYLRLWKNMGQASEMVLMLACLVLATALRLSFAVGEPFWGGEADWNINALSILERGYPADSYLGIPIYETVLLKTSPDSKEYEFGSASHSERGTVIDHGWLPLYSIAAAFALTGIHPDVDDGRPPTVRHGSPELTKRKIVPRLSSVIFAALFLFLVYRLGRMILGLETAWSVLMAAAFAQPLVLFGWQAGDYSATLALSTLAGIAVWKLTHQGEWRHSVLTGVALVLLFHTHLLSFMILSAVLLANVFARDQPRWKSKLLLTGVIVIAAIAPWWYWTNFFEISTRTPMAWPLLAFPSDFVFWFTTRKAFMAAAGVVIMLVILSAAFPRLRPARRIIEAAGDGQAFYFTLTWFVSAYLAFLFLSPAASFAKTRLMLVLAVPGYLLFALCVAVAARTITPRFSIALAPLVVLVFLSLRGAATFSGPPPATPGGVETFVDLATHWTLEPKTKIYAWPDENLLLTYVSGLPVQSVAPVRKEFLDEYSGDVIFVETGKPYAEPPLAEVQTIANEHGVALSLAEARQATLRVQRFGAREYLRDLVTDVWPPAEPLGPIDGALIARYTDLTLLAGQATAEQYRLLHGFAPTSRMTSHLLPVYYWFVNPEMHLGDRLNYRDRIRGATAIVLPNGSIIFDARRNREVPLVDQARYLAILPGASTAGS